MIYATASRAIGASRGPGWRITTHLRGWPLPSSESSTQGACATGLRRRWALEDLERRSLPRPVRSDKRERLASFDAESDPRRNVRSWGQRPAR
jgi:hypothetical protein